MKTMKVNIVLGMLLVFVLMISGCSNQKSVEEDSSKALKEKSETAITGQTQSSEQTEVEENDASNSEIQSTQKENTMNTIYLKINDTVLTATLVDNSSTQALLERLEEADISVDMSDYANMEKVGSIGASLPSNNKQTTTQAGDIILYQGNALVIYYDTNSWNFTRLGKIDNMSQKELKNVLGKGDVTVTLSLNK